MKILISKTGYTWEGLLVPAAQAGPLLEALSQATWVKIEEGHSRERRRVTPGEDGLSVEVIPDDALCLPGQEGVIGQLAERVAAEAERRSKAETEVATLRTELKKLRDQVTAAAELAKPKEVV